tara:strand:+ start:1015 stop:1431 length:417 start_codon:yes stop_codon:yes gene_type:complete
MNDLTVEQQQLVDDMVEEVLSGFTDIVMVSNFCEPEHSMLESKVTVFPPRILCQLRAKRHKLRRHIDAYCIAHNVFSKEESFTVKVNEADEIMTGCTMIIEEFNALLLELYKQYREVLEPLYSESQWCTHNFLNAFVE